MRILRVLFVAISWSFMWNTPSSAQPARAFVQDRAPVSVTVYPALDPKKFGYLPDFLLQTGILNLTTDELQRQVMLTERLEVVAGECGDNNSFYYRNQQAVFICYEKVDEILRSNPSIPERERITQAAWAIEWVVFHEIGHKMTAELLPRLARSATAADSLRFQMEDERRADQFATLTMLRTDPSSPLAAGVWWILRNGGVEQARFLDHLEWVVNPVLNRLSTLPLARPPWVGRHPHDSDVTRFTNIVCLTYGSNPLRFAALGNSLSAERRAECAVEYRARRAEWDRLLVRRRPPPGTGSGERFRVDPNSWPRRLPTGTPSEPTERPYITGPTLIGRWSFTELLRARGTQQTCSDDEGSLTIKVSEERPEMDFDGYLHCIDMFPEEESDDRTFGMWVYYTHSSIFFWLPPCLYSGYVTEEHAKLEGTVRCGVPRADWEPMVIDGTWQAVRQ